MNDAFGERVRSAATAAWWTIVIAVIWMTLAWVIYLWILSAKPDWLITLWGGELTWDQVRSIMITFFAAFKLILWTALLGTIWATLWSRRLRRSGGSQ